MILWACCRSSPVWRRHHEVGGDGLTWETAFDHVQDALEVAVGDNCHHVADAGLLQGCLTGANVPVEPSCAN